MLEQMERKLITEIYKKVIPQIKTNLYRHYIFLIIIFINTINIK